MVIQMVSNIKALVSETELLLSGKMSMVTALVLDPRMLETSGSVCICYRMQVDRFSLVLVVLTLCLSVQQLDPPQQEQLNAALSSVAQQLPRLADVPWLCPVIDPSDHEVITLLYTALSTG